MVWVSLSLLAIAALVGSALATRGLRIGGVAPRGWTLRALHALLGIGGFAALLLTLRGPPRGEAMGVGSFGRIAAALLATAMLVGFAILVTHVWYRRAPGTVIGIHATVAISGLVILAAYALVG